MILFISFKVIHTLNSTQPTRRHTDIIQMPSSLSLHPSSAMIRPHCTILKSSSSMDIDTNTLSSCHCTLSKCSYQRLHTRQLALPPPLLIFAPCAFPFPLHTPLYSFCKPRTLEICDPLPKGARTIVGSTATCPSATMLQFLMISTFIN
jgi:hypothetical protein